MNFKNYETVSPEIKEQIRQVCEIWRKHLDKDLYGIYLHGSMALACFQERVSDIDILTVTGRKLNRAERLAVAKEILSIDQKPCPLEMSALYIKDIRPWRYPARCQFHYSDYWTEHYKKLLGGCMQGSFLVDEDFEDTDIACHIRLTKQCGICLYGQPVDAVFPDVPEDDFWQSISRDIDQYDFSAYNPRYFTSNILVLGRILSYKREKRILSKYEGGLWMMEHIPAPYRYIVENALRVWYCGEEQIAYKQEDLEGLKSYLIACIKA